MKIPDVTYRKPARDSSRPKTYWQRPTGWPDGENPAMREGHRDGLEELPKK